MKELGPTTKTTPAPRPTSEIFSSQFNTEDRTGGAGHGGVILTKSSGSN